MQLFYTPDHARVGDVIPYYENGEFQLFYLKNWNLFLKVYYTEIIKEMFFCIWTHEILFLIECKKIHKS